MKQIPLSQALLQTTPFVNSSLMYFPQGLYVLQSLYILCQILKVYIVFCIPYLLVRDVFVYNDVSKFIRQVLFFDRNVSSFWFLIAILICYFIYPTVEFLLRKKKNNIIVCCVVVYIICGKTSSTRGNCGRKTNVTASKPGKNNKPFAQAQSRREQSGAFPGQKRGSMPS